MSGGRTGITAAHYRPLQLIGGFLVLLSGGTLIWHLALGATDLIFPLALIGSLGLYWWIMATGFIGGYNVRNRQAAQAARRIADDAESPVEPETWADIPPAPPGQGHLYVLRFSSGTVKVGQSTDPARRLGQHRRYGWAFGVTIARAWVSSAHAEYEATEGELIDFAASIASGDRARREFFHGADFDELVRYAAELAAGAPGTP